jgi:phosphate transport system protein
MARLAFDQGLAEIQEDVLKMGEIAKEAVRVSMEALAERNMEKIQEVNGLEERSDLLNLSVEDRCLKLTALQQPVARDLRFIASMMKISDRFERLVDYTVKIVLIAEKYKEKPLLKPLIDTPHMARLCQEMIDLVLQAIREKECEPLYDLSKKDDEIDALYEQIYNELLTFMMKDPRTIDDATDLIFVARYLERMGDIVCTVGSRLIYMLEGKRVWIK